MYYTICTRHFQVCNIFFSAIIYFLSNCCVQVEQPTVKVKKQVVVRSEVHGIFNFRVFKCFTYQNFPPGCSHPIFHLVRQLTKPVVDVRGPTQFAVVYTQLCMRFHVPIYWRTRETLVSLLRGRPNPDSSGGYYYRRAHLSNHTQGMHNVNCKLAPITKLSRNKAGRW